MGTIPELMGFKYLSPGRLGLAFYYKDTDVIEVRVADVWKTFESRKNESMFKNLFNEKNFSEVCYYCWNVCIPAWGNFTGEELFRMSYVVKEDFLCLK